MVRQVIAGWSRLSLSVRILIGLGLGPLTVGLLSDFYANYFGENSLRYAMLTVGVLSSPAILLFFLAARALPGDLASKAAADR